MPGITPRIQLAEEEMLWIQSKKKWSQRRRKFKPFLSLIIIGSVRSPAD